MGQLIRQAREAKGFSQEELAELVYKRRPTISEMEHGKMYPYIMTMLLLSVYLEKPLSYFFPSMLGHLRENSDLNEETELVSIFVAFSSRNSAALRLHSYAPSLK